MESLLNLTQHGGPFKFGFYVIRETSGVLLFKKKTEALNTCFLFFRSSLPVNCLSFVEKCIMFVCFLTVKLQFPYELSFLSVFWITSKSNQKQVGCCERSLLRNRETQKHDAERHQAFELNLFLTSMPLYMVPESFVLQEVHKMTKYGTENIAWQTKSECLLSLLKAKSLSSCPATSSSYSNISSKLFTFSVACIHLCGN